MPPRNGSDDITVLAARLEAMGNEPVPPDIRGILHRLFEGQKFVEFACGRLAGEVGILSNDVRTLKLRARDSRRKIDAVTNEMEDTKTFELRELRAERRKFFWLVFAAVVTSVVAGTIGALLHKAFHG